MAIIVVAVILQARQIALGHSPLAQSLDLEGHDLARFIAVAIILIVMVCGRHFLWPSLLWPSLYRLESTDCTYDLTRTNT